MNAETISNIKEIAETVAATLCGGLIGLSVVMYWLWSMDQAIARAIKSIGKP